MRGGGSCLVCLHAVSGDMNDVLPFQIVSIHVSHDVFETVSLSFLLYFHSGAQCGTDLGECTQDADDATATDSSTGDAPADTPVDTSSAAIRGVVAALAIFAGSSTMLA